MEKDFIKFKDVQIGDVFVTVQGHEFIKIADVDENLRYNDLPYTAPNVLDLTTKHYCVAGPRRLCKIVKARLDPKWSNPIVTVES